MLHTHRKLCWAGLAAPILCPANWPDCCVMTPDTVLAGCVQRDSGFEILADIPGVEKSDIKCAAQYFTWFLCSPAALLPAVWTNCLDVCCCFTPLYARQPCARH